MSPEDIKATRIALGLTQAAFAEKLGCGLRTLQHWEQSDGPNTRTPRGATITLLKQFQQEAKRKKP